VQKTTLASAENCCQFCWQLCFYVTLIRVNS
jgi:hypothetical protein